MNETRLQTPIKNLINLYVSRQMLNSENFRELWEKAQVYLKKDEAKTMWAGYVEDHVFKYGEDGYDM